MILFETLILILISLIIFELFFYTICVYTNKKFQWLIIKKDLKPILSKKGLDKFNQHGYDSELGWVRKPETSNVELGKDGKTKWHIDKNGCTVTNTRQGVTAQFILLSWGS